tara:strand:+ start:10489 stop:11652 length:1164 start_codon:yes stop_codon:yes gene_type:complete
MVTLDNIHSDKINSIKDFDLVVKQSILEELKARRDELSSNSKDAHEWLDIVNKIRDCEKEIEDFKSNKTLHDYYLNTGDILFQYYDTIENIDADNTPQQPVLSNKQDNILSYLNIDDNIDKSLNKEIDEEELPSYIFEKYASREELRTEYLLRVNESKYDVKKTSQKMKVSTDVCSECNSELTHIQSESVIECTKCGHLMNIIIDTEKTSYKEPPKESCYYSYRRSNHFNEWIAQFQGKETTQIPSHVLVQIVNEIKKERIQDLSQLTVNKLRSILKKLKLNKFYEHIHYIKNLLNGKPAPYMTRQMEEILRIMFQKIQGPFLEFCPKKRKNFLSYSYVLNKFVGLLGLDHLQTLFPLLKSREKLHAQDAIWKKICEKVGWEFHKSI